MCVQDREDESEPKKNCRQPGGDLDQNVGRLRSENIFRYPAAKGRAQAFAARTLHQDHQQHQQRDDHVDDEQKVNQKLHEDGEYECTNDE